MVVEAERLEKKVECLRHGGYISPQTVFDAVKSWHQSGQCRDTRVRPGEEQNTRRLEVYATGAFSVQLRDTTYDNVIGMIAAHTTELSLSGYGKGRFTDKVLKLLESGELVEVGTAMEDLTLRIEGNRPQTEAEAAERLKPYKYDPTTVYLIRSDGSVFKTGDVTTAIIHMEKGLEFGIKSRDLHTNPSKS